MTDSADAPTPSSTHYCDTGHFDRTVCACGAMHSYCATCEALQDPCPYFTASDECRCGWLRDDSEPHADYCPLSPAGSPPQDDP